LCGLKFDFSKYPEIELPAHPVFLDSMGYRISERLDAPSHMLQDSAALITEEASVLSAALADPSSELANVDFGAVAFELNAKLSRAMVAAAT
jgi:hypothetical protein